MEDSAWDVVVGRCVPLGLGAYRVATDSTSGDDHIPERASASLTAGWAKRLVRGRVSGIQDTEDPLVDPPYTPRSLAWYFPGDQEGWRTEEKKQVFEQNQSMRLSQGTSTQSPYPTHNKIGSVYTICAFRTVCPVPSIVKMFGHRDPIEDLLPLPVTVCPLSLSGFSWVRSSLFPEG